MVLVDLKDSGLIPEGKAHFLVTEVDLTDPEKVIVNLDILAHETDSAAGRQIRDIFSLSGKFAIRGVHFARACGVLTEAEVTEKQAAGLPIDVPFEKTYLSTFCGCVKHSKDKKYSNVGWDYKRAATEESTGYPKNPQFLPGGASNLVDTPKKPDSDIPF